MQTIEIIRWLRDKAARAHDLSWVRMLDVAAKRLLDALKQHKGSVILSGYPSELYDRELAGWQRITRRSYNQNADPRTEVLWLNFELPPMFEMEGE